MSLALYYIICGILSLLVITGIWMMTKVKTSVNGNLLSAFSLFAGVVVTLVFYNILSVIYIYLFMLIGTFIGFVMYRRVKMIQMPQMVALLNGVGGAASAIVGALSLLGVGIAETEYFVFSNVTASLAFVIGMITLVGSLIAAGKLHRILPQKPVVWKNHGAITKFTLLGSAVAVLLAVFIGSTVPIISEPYFILFFGFLFSASFGYVFAIRVGGADMPITISLLNSLSGVAGAVAGMAIGHILLVAVGGVVGASGLLLTQIMCRAMNRSLMDILTGNSSIKKPKTKLQDVSTEVKVEHKTTPLITEKPKKVKVKTAANVLATAKSVIIVPGYGMALAQAQHLVKQLVDQLEQNGAEVKYAIHPVAGRMPGHMNVLLAEADVSYEQLYEMDAVNYEFKNVDAVVVIGANDVLNPAARDAKDTPIYGMPILNVDEAKEVIICNFDLNPGYAGVDNPLYQRTEGIYLQLGDAKKTIQQLLMDYNKAKADLKDVSTKDVNKKDLGATTVLANAKSVIIVPGYGMALAQAQHLVKQLADQLELNGADVKYAIHPVAGRMPGHMNVLLAEADVSYEQLYEMDAMNDEFKNVDAVVVIGANDVLNPAARDAKDTPIYGMPILNVDQAKEVIICNFDLNPGYAGVNNPLYERTEGMHLKLGDAKETLRELLTELQDDQPTFDTEFETDLDKQAPIAGAVLAAAHSVIIVPGYGMALAQAQHLVKQLADQLELNGAVVKYAIHPVAGRMPGHMNVLLAEADVSYEQLYEMDVMNDEFKSVDAVVVIGANDVLNPAARDAVDTPIYGMPILNVDQAKDVIICNFDLNPGYAGVENPLYQRDEGVILKLGDAKETIQQLLTELRNAQSAVDTNITSDVKNLDPMAAGVLAAAHSVIIVPGYGMALAQAQHLVKQLADQLELNGAQVKYVIHPVAGRMPGHMNVLLAEADVSYEQLYEMDAMNDEFESVDAVVVIGANDVLNPAARDAVDTPIYGMPILNVDQAKEVIICNFDLKPGYAGVENPLYERTEGVYLKLGDAKETLQDLLKELIHIQNSGNLQQ
ncbi:MAG: NAD(P)(+) transhydrogenase (AB-specific) [Bacteroidales bacterium]|nr:NAD(P)(+) transhydrogenase (AB-specific) [Bacteroidales bacterium]